MPEVNFTIVQPSISQIEFFQLLVKHFPEIAEDVFDEDYNGLVHLQIGCMARYASELIRHGKFDFLKQLFDFFQTTVEKVDSSTENALYVSFLEHVDMAG
jgi:hypothetical protein